MDDYFLKRLTLYLKGLLILCFGYSFLYRHYIAQLVILHKSSDIIFKSQSFATVSYNANYPAHWTYARLMREMTLLSLYSYISILLLDIMDNPFICVEWMLVDFETLIMKSCPLMNIQFWSYGWWDMDDLYFQITSWVKDISLCRFADCNKIHKFSMLRKRIMRYRQLMIAETLHNTGMYVQSWSNGYRDIASGSFEKCRGDAILMTGKMGMRSFMKLGGTATERRISEAQLRRDMAKFRPFRIAATIGNVVGLIFNLVILCSHTWMIGEGKSPHFLFWKLILVNCNAV